MKTVFIVRHAKSSWDISGIPDEERPLLEKGKKKTKKIIDFLHQQNISVDHIISSHAARALETAKILAHALNYPKNRIKVDPHIYFANGNRILDLFYDLSDQYNSVMIVGHNPTLTDLVNQYLRPRIDNLPTSGIVSISFDTDQWEKIPLANHTINFVVFPKELTGTKKS
ncbi:MAG: histidine phosphatase family protein [Bacteroidales bacterium]|nr:histidine phosphatase family protein [Bacteroidales bacterium]